VKDLDRLLGVRPPEPPPDFEAFWRSRYERAARVAPKPKLRDTGTDQGSWRVFEVSHSSTDRVRVKGWLLLPVTGVVRRGFVIGHGYTARTGPDTHLPFADAALLFPCSRGLGLTRHGSISSNPMWHVLHDIQDRNRYVLGGCVEDLWSSVSALLRLCPEVAGHVGYLGISFGGGIGALAMPWETRIQRVHLNVPTFGNHPLRLELPSTGSAASVQKFVRRHPKVWETLPYYDAATAAFFAQQPLFCALAKVDPAVAPEGQFSVYNAWKGPKILYSLTAGHLVYPEQEREERELLREIDKFFRDL
jgi:cephalosporin-C deacetylase